MHNKAKLAILNTLLFIGVSYCQIQITVEFDPVINTIGGKLNPDTDHEPVLAIGCSISYKDRDNLYLTLNYEYVNLSEKYNAFYWGLGYWIDGSKNKRGSKFDFITYIDMGLIQRELIKVDEFDPRQDPVSITGALNGVIQYELLKGWHLSARANLRLRTDLENRLLGFNGSIGITKDIW